MKNPTTLDYIILGLIQQQPLSGYRIRKAFEDTALGNFGGSPGTIYPALKRLEKNNLILKKSVNGGNKSKYAVTNAGLKELRSWMETLPSKDEVKKNRELLILKFAFMDPMIGPKHKVEYLEAMKYELQNYLRELEQYLRKETTTMPLNGRLALEHGILSYRASIEWCDQAKNYLSEVPSST